MDKQLIYFTVSNNEKYIKLADLCVKSLYKTGYDGDILFITDMRAEILSGITFKKNPLFLELGTSNLHESSANKLKLYLFDHIEEYDRIIFSDVDILWLKSPSSLFYLLDDDTFHVSNEPHLMSERWWGGDIISPEERRSIDEGGVKGINAGIFGLTNKVVHHLREIDLFVSQNTDKINACLEQPFFNVYLYRNQLYQNDFNGVVSHNGYNMDNYDGVLLHFAGGPGNFTTKYDKMLNYAEKNKII